MQIRRVSERCGGRAQRFEEGLMIDELQAINYILIYYRFWGFIDTYGKDSLQPILFYHIRFLMLIFGKYWVLCREKVLSIL